jgi:hypothetical protein
VIGARVRILTALIVAAATMGAAAAPTIDREIYAITGTYKYERGDVITYPCGGRVCRDTLVRDKYLHDHGVELFGKEITVRVRRIDACRDPRSTKYACQTRVSDTALLIVEWIRPRVVVPGGNYSQ